MAESPRVASLTLGNATYVCSHEIGRGGFAVVLQATSDLQVAHAVKRVDMLASTKEAAADAEREASILGMVSHPHVVGFLGSVRDARHLYMVLELCRGPDLEQLLQARVHVHVHVHVHVYVHVHVRPRRRAAR